MSISVRYFINDSNGNFIDWAQRIDGLSILGKEAFVDGSGGNDTVYVQQATSATLTNLYTGDNRIYLTGNLSDYRQTIEQDTGTYTFERIHGLQVGQVEIVKLTVSNNNDVLYFSDGHVTINAETNTAVYDPNNSTAPFKEIIQVALVAGGTPVNGLPETGTTTTSTAPINVYVEDPNGAAIPSAPQTNQSMIIDGSGGVDVVYVRAGTSVDATALYGGSDIVYLTGSLADYSQLIDQDTGVYTFTRTAGLPSGVTEVVKVTVSNEDDVLSFANGQITINAATNTHVFNGASSTPFQQIQTAWLAQPGTIGLSDIASIAIASTPAVGHGNTYAVGDVIEFDVTMKSAVTHTGAPVFTFKIGTTDVTAALDTVNSSSTVLKFKHTVVAGEFDANGISYGANAVGLNGGTIMIGSVAAKITNGAGLDQATHMVDTVAPVVTDATISISGATGTGGAYKTGDTVTVVYDPAGDTTLATVTADFTAFGGGAAVAATLATTGVNAGKWVATYTVAAGTIDATNLNVSVTATDHVGLTTTASDTTNATVDNHAPAVLDANISISGATGTAGAYKVGDTVVAVFTPTGNTDLSAVTVDFTAFGGGAAVAATLATTGANAGKYVATYVVAAGTIDAVNANVSVTATDDAGNTTTTADSSNATVDNQAPVVADASISISGATGNANTIYKIGDTVTAVFDPAGNTDLASVAMNFSGFGGAASVAATLQTTGVNTGKYVATYQVVSGVINTTNVNVSVTATDNAGNAITTADTSNATVDTAAPTVVVSSDKYTVSAGQTANITFTFSEAPVGFAWDAVTQTGDLTVANGTVSALTATADPKVFTAVFTPTPGNTVQVTGSVGVTAGSYTDGSSDSGAAGTPVNMTVPVTTSITTQFSAATDDATLNGSTAVGAITAGQSSDDATPTLTGTIGAALSGTQAVWIYDTVNGVATKLGSATITGSTNWSYTPAPALATGVHSLTARVEDSSTGAIGSSSTAFSHKVQTVAISGFFDNVGTVTGTVAASGSSDDSTPTLNGTLGVALSAGEEVGIYDGTTLLGTATVTGTSWTFAPTTPLSFAAHTLQAAVQATGATTLTSARAASATAAITLTDPNAAPTAVVTTLVATDDVATNGSYVGALTAGSSTDDTVLALSGAYTGTIAAGEVIQVFDGTNLLGTATVNAGASTWSFTTPILAPAGHTFTAKVTNNATNISSTSTGVAATGVAIVENGLGVIQTTVDSGTVGTDTRMRYVMVRRVGTTADYFEVGELQVYSGGVNVAAGKPATTNVTGTLAGWGGTTALTDGVTNVQANTFITPQTTDGWVQVDLGGYYTISEVRVYTGSTSTRYTGANVFASSADMSGLSNAAQLAGTNGVMKINSAALNGTTAAGAYQGATGTWGQGPAISDNTPTFSGLMTASLGSDDVLGVYDGSTRLGDAVLTGSSWSFTVGTDGTVLTPLTSGIHTINVKIENATHSQTRLLSSTPVNIVSATAPTAVVDSLVATDDVGIATAYSAGNYIGTLTSGQNTDDKVLALTGTFTGTLVAGDVVQIYDGTTLLGAATSTSATTNGTWTFTTSALTTGTHDLNAKVGNSASGLFSTSTGTGASFKVVENNLGAVTLSVDSGGIAPDSRVRYVMVRRAVTPADYFEVGEVQVYSGGTNVASGKTATTNGSLIGGWGTTAALTDGVTNGQANTFIANVSADSWVQIDLGGYYNVSEVRVYTGLTANRLTGANVFVSNTDMSALSNATLLSGGTLSAPATKVNSAAFNGTTAAGSYQGATGSWGTISTVTDTTPLLTGTLDTLIGSADVLAVYDGTTRLGTAVVSGNSWSFLVGTNGDSAPHNALLTAGDHTLKVQIENSSTNVARMVQTTSINVATSSPPSAVISSLAVTDDSGSTASYQGGNYTGALTNGMNTDDSLLTLSGNYSGTMASGDVVKVFDNNVLLASFTASNGSWSYTTSALAAGAHSFTAQVSNLLANQSSVASTAVSVVVNALSAITVSTNEGSKTQASSVRYIMLRRDVDNADQNFDFTEVAVYSNGVNVAKGKSYTTSQTPLAAGGGVATTALTDESMTNRMYFPTATGAGGWVQIDLGANYAVDSVLVTPQSLGRGQNTYTFMSQSSLTGYTVAQLTGGSPPVPVISFGAITTAPQTFTTTAAQSAYQIVDSTPTLSGTLDADLGTDVLGIWIDGVRVSTVTPTGLNWTYTPTALTAGTHSIEARIESSAQVMRVAQKITVVYAAAVAPTTTTSLVATDDVATNGSYVGALTANSSTDDTVLALSGTLSAALSATERVDVYDGTTLLGSATVTGTAWTYATPTLTNGNHTFTAKVASSLSGLSGTASTALSVIENTMGGLQIAVSEGTLSGTTMTDTTPTLSGSIGATKGSADVVGVYIDGTRVGDATVTGTNWTFQVGTDGTSTALTAGSHTVQAKIESAGGAQARVVGAASSISVLSSAPTAVVTSLVATDDVATNNSYAGALTTNSSTDDTTLALSGAFTGTLAAGDVVQVFDGAQFLGTASTSSATNGTWSYTTSALTIGSHTFTAKVTNTQTSTSSTSTGSALGVTVVENSLGTIGVSVDVGSFTANTLSDTTPTFSGTLGTALASGEKVTVYDTFNAVKTAIGTAVVAANGTSWSFTPTTALATGSHTITAVVQNSAGTQDRVASVYAGLIVATAPQGAVDSLTVTDNVGSTTAYSAGNATGAMPTGSNVDDARPVISGTISQALSAGEVVRVYDTVNGVATLLGSATVTGTAWTFTPATALATGGHSITAQVANAATNATTNASTAYGVTVNSLAAGITLTADGGTVVSNATSTATSDPTPTFSGGLGAALGSADVVAVYIDGVRSGPATVTGTTWSYTPTATLAAGSHLVTVQIENSSTNAVRMAQSKSFSVVDASTPPAAKVSALNVTDTLNANAAGDFTGALATGVTTNDSRPTVSGTLSVGLGAGEVVQVYDNTSTLLGTATVTGTTWSFTAPALAVGAHSISAKVTSTLNNQSSTGNAAALGFNVNTLGAVALSVTAGKAVVGTSTTDDTPTFSGTLGTALASGEVLGAYIDGVRKGDITPTGTTWTYDAPTQLAGNHTFKVQIESSTGNVMRMAQSQAFSVVASATPTALVNSIAVVDASGTSNGYANGNFTGTLSTSGANLDDTKPVISGTLNQVLATGDVVQIFDGTALLATAAVSGTSWSYTPPVALATGSHTLTAKVTNTTSGLSSASTGLAATGLQVVENSLSGITVGVDIGAATSTGFVRYVMLQQNGTSNFFNLGEIQVMSNGTNVALNKTVTSNYASSTYAPNSKIVDGGTTTKAEPGVTTSDLWVQVDLGAYYAVDSLVIYPNAEPTYLGRASNLYVFTSQNDMSTTPLATLVAGAGGTVTNSGLTNFTTINGVSYALPAPSYATVDNTPTLSGTLDAALGSADALAVYDGTTLLGTATVSGLNWSYTVPSNSVLSPGTHTLKVQIEDVNSHALRMVQSKTLNVIAAVAPSTTTTLVATDDVATNGSYVGALTANSSTDDKVLTLSGTLSSALVVGEVVQVYDGATLLGFAASIGTAWTYTTPTLAAGSHALSAKVTNAGGLSGAAASLTISEQSLWMGGSINSYVSATAPVSFLAGTGSGSRVADLTLAKLTGTMGGASVGAGFAANLVLADTSTAGQLKFWMTRFDGNSTYATQVQLTDTVSGIAAQVLQSKSVTGNYTDGSFNFNASGNGAVTTVASSSTNGAVGVASLALKQSSTTPITGTLGAVLGSGEALGIYVDGVRVADNTSGVTITTQTDGTVTWVYTPTASTLPAGAHTITAQVENAATGAARMVQTSSVTVASTLAPVAKVATLLVSDDNSTGYAAGDATGTVTGSTDDTTPTISGTLDKGLAVGEVVQVFDGSKLLGNATVSGLTWTLTPDLTVGSHTISAKVANSYDSTLASISSASPVTVVVNSLGWSTLAADTGAALGNLMPASGASASGTLASTDSTPTIGGKLGNALAAGEQVGVYDNGTFLGTASVNGTSWTYTTSALSTGVHSLQVRIEDTATRTTRMALSQNFEVVAANVTPATQVATLVVTDAVSAQYPAGDRTGVLAANESTNDTKPVISGTLSAGLQNGEVVQVFDGSTLLGNATVNGFNWSYTTTALQALATGAHTLSAKVVNTASGNASAAVSQTIQEQSMSALTVTPQSGTAQAGSGVRYIMVRKEATTAGYLTMSDVQVLVNGVNIAVGKTVTASQAAITGTTFGNLVDANTSTSYIGATKATDNWVQIDLGANYNVGSVVVQPEGAKFTIGGSFVFASTQSMSGSTLTALKSGAAAAIKVGEIPLTDNPDSAVAARPVATFTMPATAQAPSSTVNSATVAGALAAPLVAGEQLGIYVKNGSGAYVYSGVATVALDGTWTASLTGLAAGTNTIKAQVEDAFGVVRMAQTQTLNIVANATPTTTATIVSVNDNEAGGLPTGGDFTGNLNSGDNTTDYTPTLAGTLSAALQAGEVVQVLDNGNAVGSATVTGSSWTFTPSTNVAVGNHAYTAKVLNTANGNAGTASAAFTVIAQTLGEILPTVDTGTQNSTSARYIMFRNAGPYPWLNILEMQVMSGGSNVALGKTVKMSNFALSESMSGAALVDGYKTVQGDTYWSSAHVVKNNNDGWFQIDLGQAYAIDSVRFTSTYSVILQGGQVYASNQDMSGLSKGSMASLAALGNQGVTKLATVDAGSGGSAFDFVTATKGKVFTDTTPTFSGQLGTDLGSTDVVGVYVDGVRSGTATITGTGANTTWSYTTPVQTTGDHTVKVQIERADGTMMLARTDTFSITTAASQTVLGMSASATTTDAAGTVTVSGMLNAPFVAGQKLAIYDGTASDSTLLGYATVANGASTFSYSATGFGVGAHTLTARVLSVDGTVGTSTPGTATVTIAASAPTQTVTVLGGYETTGAFATTGQGVNNLYADGSSTSSGNTTHLYVTGDSTPGMYGRLSSVLGTNEALKAYVDGVEVAGTLNVTGLNWNFTPTTGMTDGYHDLTFKVVNTTLSNAGAASTAYRVEVDAVASNSATITSATDNYGVVQGTLTNGDVSDAPRLTINGVLSEPGTTGTVKVYEVVGNADVLMGSVTVTSGSSWSFVTDPLGTGSHVFKAKFVNTAGVEQAAAASTFTIDHQVQDGAVTNLTTLAGVDTASLTYSKQTLDFTKLGTSTIDKVDLGAFGGNTVKLSAADVLDAGTGLFTTAKGWTFANATDSTHAGTYHQMVMAGNSSVINGASTVQIAEAVNASNTNPWALTGTATNGGNTYNVYTNLATNNAQLLIDQNLTVSNVVL